MEQILVAIVEGNQTALLCARNALSLPNALAGRRCIIVQAPLQKEEVKKVRNLLESLKEEEDEKAK